MTGTTLDPARRHLVPVAPVALAHEPDDVHLALYEWSPRLGEWLTGWAICGRSSTQGRLPDGTPATCARCVALRAGYERALAGPRPGGALRDQLAEAVHATSVCEVGDPVRCGGGCRDAAGAVLPVIEQHSARLREKHTAALRHADDTNNALMEEVQRYAAGNEQPVLWSVYNDMHKRAITAEADLHRMLRESPWLRARDEEREDAQAALASVREYVLTLDHMAESTASANDRRLYRALAADLRKRLGYDTNDTPEENRP